MFPAAIRSLLGFLTPYPLVLPFVILLGTVAALAEGLAIGLMIPFLASLIQTGPSGGGTVAQVISSFAELFPEPWRLAGVGTTIVIFVLLSCAVNYAYIRLFCWASTQVTHDLRVEIFSSCLTSKDFLTGAGAQGRRVKAIDGAAYRSGQAIINLSLLSTSAVTILLFSIFLLLISWQMTLLLLLGVLLTNFLVRLFLRKIVLLSRNFESGTAAITDAAMQVVSTIRMVRIFGQQGRELAKFSRASQQVQKDEVQLETLRRATTPLIDALMIPLLITTLVVSFYNGIGPAILLPYLFLAFRLQRYAREFDQSQVRLAADAGAILELKTLLSEAQTIKQVPIRSRNSMRLKAEISLEEVTFCHSKEPEARAPTIDDISLRIRCGETLAVVGASGSGKSTLINLIMGLYEPTSGDVKVDGIPLSSYNIDAWRLRIGFAGQDADLLSGTIRENIAYSNPHASLNEIVEAAKKANISSFIEQLPDGFETYVGAHGLELSGGERQRLAIARALLRNPDVLILDEATNAIDNKNEQAVRKTLKALAGTLTMIIVAHRLSSIASADRVVVMNAGRIDEVGPPGELIARGAGFACLNELETT